MNKHLAQIEKALRTEAFNGLNLEIYQNIFDKKIYGSCKDHNGNVLLINGYSLGSVLEQLAQEMTAKYLTEDLSPEQLACYCKFEGETPLSGTQCPKCKGIIQ